MLQELRLHEFLDAFGETQKLQRRIENKPEFEHIVPTINDHEYVEFLKGVDYIIGKL